VIGVPDLREDLGREELEAAQRGFERLLRRKRFSRAFLDRHAADLLAKARLEYSQHVAAGGEVRNPAGWIIHCAWRRTQNLLEQEGRAPQVVSIDNGVAFANSSATPEEEVLTSDRYRQLQAALEQLPREERKVIALTYFEGMSVREVGRTLKWDKCKADRRHRAALQRLKDLLGVTDIDALQIEIGIVAWASIGAGIGTRPRLPASIGTVFDGIAAAVGRGQELTRRLLTGGAAEPGMAPAISGAARTAGVCGAAAVACVATGLVGPGVSGVDVFTNQPHNKPAAERQASPATVEETGAATEAAQPAPSVAGGSANATESQRARQEGSKTKAARPRRASTTASAASATPHQVAEEFDPFTGGGESSLSSSGASGSSTSSGSTGSSVGSSSPPPPAASSKQVESEFGL
jgi:RNA polymerase sigma factor (sigma-70 family)